MLNGMQKPWMRQQENWILSVRQEVLQRASTKLLIAWAIRRQPEARPTKATDLARAGCLVRQQAPQSRSDSPRMGDYIRVIELDSDSSKEDLEAPYTLREVVGAAKAGGKSAPVGITGIGIPSGD